MQKFNDKKFSGDELKGKDYEDVCFERCKFGGCNLRFTGFKHCRFVICHLRLFRCVV